ncbi:FAD-dependent oxidoreductase [Neolewinella lacunae]|uniref:NAD(P)/FAD-dependent oxidoreductase n=1 Tax=Neolewinella lacunae TaxID=1517758 RepID=UPI0025B53131|nr:FAD-dependent oxidoreductase [Neolewinella lacunae]MDN3635913.1 FAD-dependent oxidoreductase [Neolewinella lacunae]
MGQGLAGTLLGYRLERAGCHVDYVDAPEQTAASDVAAGIINPITGRRFVKSWRIDELLPAARDLYQELERTYGVKIWYDLPLVRSLFNRGDRNDWEVRSADPGYAEYLDDHPDPGRIPEQTVPVFAYAGVRHTARVDLATLVAAHRSASSGAGRFRAQAFDYATLPALLGKQPADGALNAGARPGEGAGAAPASAAPYDRIICCEGWRARFNPYFAYLPHGGMKGDVLLVRTTAPPLERMFKHRIFLVPQSDGTYWVGATSDNRFADDAPSPANYQFLSDRLEELLTVPYTIIGHRAAVRPTVRDRRLLLGSHPSWPELLIFNGLGTKGASLAPLASRWLADYLLAGAPLPAEVDIQRFAP